MRARLDVDGGEVRSRLNRRSQQADLTSISKVPLAGRISPILSTVWDESGSVGVAPNPTRI